MTPEISFPMVLAVGAVCFLLGWIVGAAHAFHKAIKTIRGGRAPIR